MSGKILKINKPTLKSSEEIKIEALADKVRDLEYQVTKLSGYVLKLLKLLKIQE